MVGCPPPGTAKGTLFTRGLCISVLLFFAHMFFCMFYRMVMCDVDCGVLEGLLIIGSDEVIMLLEF